MLGAHEAQAEPAAAPAAPLAAGAPSKSDPPPPVPLRLVPREITPELVWRPEWPRVQTAELIATGVFAAGIVPFLALPPSQKTWTSTNSFDEGARNALRLGGEPARNAARDMSDLLLSINATFPFFIDALGSAYWSRKSRDVAFQMMEIDAEVLIITGFLQSAVSTLSNRQRPYGRLCPTDADAQSRDCFSNTRYHSFFSGHSATAFAGAGLICTHHMKLSLWGGGAPDVLACVGGFASAAATAYLRVASDQHYLSDILVGSAIGTMTGLGLPWLLHYRHGKSIAPRAGASRPSPVSLTFVPGPLGGSLVGSF